MQADWDRGDGAEVVCGSQVDNEWVPGGALFGFEDFGDGFRRKRIGAEAVDGLGGEGYGAARTEDVGGALDVGGVVGVEMEGWWHSGYGSGLEVCGVPSKRNGTVALLRDASPCPAKSCVEEGALDIFCMR